MFSAIFRHKQPQRRRPKAVGIVKMNILWQFGEKPLQFINVMLANRSPMSVAERGPGRMTYAKKKIKPFAEHDLRVTLECAGNKGYNISPH